MITEFLLNITFTIINFLITSTEFVISSFGIEFPQEFLNLISNGLYFSGADTFVTALTVVISWYLVQFTWAIIEWTYKKIPGVS